MKRHAFITIMLSLVLVLACSVSAVAADDLSGFPAAVDPQSWEVPENMTWDDWQNIPTVDWDSLDLPNAELQKGLLILVDYADKPFMLTQEKGSDPMGNPQIDAVAEKDLAKFWTELLNVPSELNNFTSINDFWRENSYGNWKVEIEVCGPYHLEGMEWEYGIDDFNGAPDSKRSIVNESIAAFLADPNSPSLADFNFGFIVHAGYCESSVWQELGEMVFSNTADITDDFGPTEEELAAIKAWGEQDPVYATDRNGEKYQVNDISWAEGLLKGDNHVSTRYVDWTTWLAGKSVWSHATRYTAVEGDNSGLKPGDSFRLSVQGEDGMATFAHEFGHIKNIGDNYNNPFGVPDGRTYSGLWELMSRGAFNGPGGTHTRWEVPGVNGGSAPAPHTTRLKLKQDFYTDDQYLRVSQDSLAKTGPVFADIVAREVPTTGEHGVGYGYNSLMIDLSEDKTPIVTKADKDYNWQTSTWGSYTEENPYYGKGYYQFYSLEVVQRVGYDSFSCDEGVLMIMNREIDNERAPFMWVIDAHPEDIGLVDFVRPNGEKSMVSLGDARQVADALFHAGVGEGVVSEYVDTYNNLHFYVLDKAYDAQGVLSYRVAVRSTEKDPYQRAVSAEAGAASTATQGMVAVQEIKITNTGKYTDLYRLDASNTADWDWQIANEVIEVAAGETVTVKLYLAVPATGLTATEFTVTATSEMDGNAVATVTGKITPSAAKNPFSDIKTSDWFRNDVLIAHGAGLVNGRGDGTYAPSGNVTIAEAIKLAASINQLYTNGKVTLVNGTENWYDTYVAYAVEKGIIKSGAYANLNAYATRAQFAAIFAAALPDEALPQINRVADQMLPDVKYGDSNGAAVYKLYRAGILTGNDAQGTFAPNSNIRRSEVAAIANRMVNEDSRKTISL